MRRLTGLIVLGQSVLCCAAWAQPAPAEPPPFSMNAKEDVTGSIQPPPFRIGQEQPRRQQAPPFAMKRNETSSAPPVPFSMKQR